MAELEARPHGARHARGGGRRGRAPLVAGIVAAVVVLLGVGLGVGLLVAPRLGMSGGAGSGTGSPTAPTAATQAASSSEDAPPSRPTMFGRVERVDSGDTVEVDVGGRRMEITILGMRAPAMAGPGRSEECGSRQALEFADRQLSGQMVTLVPDPTLPDTDDGGRRPAYVVLASQLSYTDAAITAGVARADTSRPLVYAPVFAREQAEAVAAKRGMWGPPCRVRP